ncbi:DNA -binding domain-containing protein [Sphingobium sp. Cam5-1]|uniref:DNA -binding domain-containing protein n=1 Tax=Sphingobium sp. Cam5-1 TaxID=2789327 RepID=UPI003FA6DA8B
MVHLHYRLNGLGSAEAGILPLRRLLHLYRHRHFARTLFPHDPWVDRGIRLLRVHDALADGASQREIGAVLFGEARVTEDWNDRSDSLRSRIRRLVREAKALAQGGYRDLMRRHVRLPDKLQRDGEDLCNDRD